MLLILHDIGRKPRIYDQDDLVCLTPVTRDSPKLAAS